METSPPSYVPTQPSQTDEGIRFGNSEEKQQCLKGEKKSPSLLTILVSDDEITNTEAIITMNLPGNIIITLLFERNNKRLGSSD